MRLKILHVLSQRPLMTGSGITLGAFVRHASAAGWDQCAVVGTSADDPRPAVGGLSRRRIHPLVFEGDDLPFPVPGMSDVMPYPSTRFSAMTPDQIEAYKASWRRHLERVVRAEAPDLVHAHHAWLVASLIRDVAPDIPVVTHCHATGLRQRVLCPHLAEGVRRDLQRNDLFLVLHGNDAKRLETELGVSRSRTRIVGAGYRQDLFHEDGRLPAADVGGEMVFVGKFARAKGLPWLLDAVERLADRRTVRLHVAGGGSGEEAAEIERRMRDMADLVIVHGRLSQPELADLMRRCAVCVLPSFYEGLPLILAEAAACGCRLVATRLRGIVDGLLPALDDLLELVPLPRLSAVDSPLGDDLPAFVDDLEEALGRALAAASAPGGRPDIDLDRLTWKATFERVEAAWRELLRATL